MDKQPKPGTVNIIVFRSIDGQDICIKIPGESKLFRLAEKDAKSLASQLISVIANETQDEADYFQEHRDNV